MIGVQPFVLDPNFFLVDVAFELALSVMVVAEMALVVIEQLLAFGVGVEL